MRNYEPPRVIVSYFAEQLFTAEGFMSCLGNEGNGPNPGKGCGENHSPH